MADLIVANHMIEAYTSAPTPAERREKNTTRKTTTMVIATALGIWAAFLAWRCGTAQRVPLHFKLCTTLLAFLFGGLYLIFYFIFAYNRCKA